MTLAQSRRFAQGPELRHVVVLGPRPKKRNSRPGRADKGAIASWRALDAPPGPKAMPFFTTYLRSQRSAFAPALWKLPTAILMPALISAGCGSDSESESATTSCVPGRTEACACTDGRMGAQKCLASASFGPCECSSSSSGGPDAGPTTSTRGAIRTPGTASPNFNAATAIACRTRMLAKPASSRPSHVHSGSPAMPHTGAPKASRGRRATSTSIAAVAA